MALSLRHTGNPSMETLCVYQVNISLGSFARIPTIEFLAILDSEIVVIIRKKATVCSVIHVCDVCNIRLHAELIIEHNEIFRSGFLVPSSLLHPAMVEDILTQPFFSQAMAFMQANGLD